MRKPDPDNSQAELLPTRAITAVQPVARPPGWVRVRSGRRTVALLHPREAEALGPAPGQGLDAACERGLAQAAARSRVRRDAERLIARRGLSRAELQSRLIEKGHEPGAVGPVLEALARAGAIDDRRLAQAAADRALTSGRRAARLAAAEIEARGVSPTAAGRAVQRAARERGETDLDRALALATSRLRGELLTKDAATQRRRLAGILARRGYDEDVVERVLNRLVADRDVPAAD